MPAPLAIASPEGCQADSGRLPNGARRPLCVARAEPRQTEGCPPVRSLSFLKPPRSISPGEAVDTRRLQVVSWHVMFMSRGKVGPLRVDGAAPQGSSGKVGVRNGATR